MIKKEHAFLNDIYPYFYILEAINDDYYELMANNSSRELYQNAEALYRLATNLLRILPIKCNGPWISKYNTVHLDTTASILLLQDSIPFLHAEYSKMLSSDKCKYVLSRVAIIRNKYTHAPHTLHLSFSIGGKTSFSGGVWYNDTLLSMSTIWLSNIICQLNIVFDRIRDYYLSIIDNNYPKYKNHPYYNKISTYSFSKYNDRYGNMPWDWIVLDEDFDAFVISETKRPLPVDQIQ